jgi:hypothetical protein
MKLVDKREQGNVMVAIYEQTIKFNPNPYYEVFSFIDGVKQRYTNAGWSLEHMRMDMDNIFNLITKGN